MLNIEQPGHYRIALLHLAFRPFFLLAGGWAVVSMALWAWLYHGDAGVFPMGLPPSLWHAHEMVFGYALAVVAGFLLTAVRNWTGVQTAHGAPLLLLALFWLAARVLAWVPGGVTLMVVVDLAFNLALLVAVLHPVACARQWKQLPILAMPLVLTLAHVIFYAGLLGGLPGGERLGLYAGLYLIVLLILVMGRRVIPFFIEKGVDGEASIRNRRWVDVATVVLALVFVAVELAQRWALGAGLLALALALLQAVRLYDWHHPDIWRKPLLWSLYLALAWIAVGFGLRGLAAFVPLDPFAALHAFAYGGIGLVTLGMMCRVSLGHTGRNVFAPPRPVQWMLALLMAGALVRVVLPLLLPAAQATWIGLSQGLWVAGFGLFVGVYASMLLRPRIDGRYG
ncbi:MAG TPA: NnrS family protein [Thioalkalivibrio sp.]|mgnify:CR=1 FL=1|nr:NnrS family protein [Thioalkalivibrio sp.]